MNPKYVVRLLALAAGLWIIGGTAEAGVRTAWSGRTAGEQVADRSAGRQQLAYLGPEQRREMRQQMREQWQQSPPRREERRPDLREQNRERLQQMPSDDRHRLREELREQRGGRGRDFGGRR